MPLHNMYMYTIHVLIHVNVLIDLHNVQYMYTIHVHNTCIVYMCMNSYHAITEHSICQPGLPGPQGLGHAGSPCLLAFHSAKSLLCLFSCSLSADTLNSPAKNNRQTAILIVAVEVEYLLVPFFLSFHVFLI